jgi:hypothetical protein
VQAEQQRRDAVGEAHDHDPERPTVQQREPHDGDVVKRVAELADRNREIEAAEIMSAQEVEAHLKEIHHGGTETRRMPTCARRSSGRTKID